MADEEDYMGDLSKFIPPEVPQPSKSKKATIDTPKNPLPPRKKTKGKYWQEQQRREKERKQLNEDEETQANLESAIPQSNIGFKLLKQMGYTPGSALGKEGKGRAEPLGIDIRRSRAGVGREDPIKEKIRIEKKVADLERRKEEAMMEEFGSRQKSQWRSRSILVNFKKAKAALDQLENREVVEVEKPEDDDEVEEKIVTEEDLLEVLMNLRDEHRYCLFCGCQYESMDALLSSCPGVDEDEH